MAADLYDAAIQKLCKWRTVFTGWQLGTRVKGDPEGDAVRNHRELTIIMRAELTALTRLCIERGAFTAEDFRRTLAEEAEFLSKAYEEKFPGFRATEFGIEIFDTKIAAQTTRGWKP
jgi:hypothetical protein